jgi:DUF971 family protein
MKDPAAHPVDVGPNEDGTALRIRWADHHVSEYQPRYLRVACRCASCVDEMSGQRILRPEDVARDVHPLAIQYVGRYALQFDWSDGHSTGIYPFRYLRELCPCPECQVGGEGQGEGGGDEGGDGEGEA